MYKKCYSCTEVIIGNNLFTRFEEKLLTLLSKQNVVKKNIDGICFNSNKTKRLFSHYDFLSDNRSLEIVLLIGYTYYVCRVRIFEVFLFDI